MFHDQDTLLKKQTIAIRLLLLVAFNGLGCGFIGADSPSTANGQAAIANPTSTVSSRSLIPYHNTIEKYSHEYGVDFALVCAIIEQESRFDASVVSHRGAMGLMQVMPVKDDEGSTAASSLSLSMPAENIRKGISLMAYLGKLFDQCSPEDKMRLTVAAYNAGPSRIYDAQDLAAYMGDNPQSWSAVRNALPLLSKGCYTLHNTVWKGGKPRSGTFRDYHQTIAYVDNVMKSYEKFSAMN
jgi:membrane-bound lytic murein transglycosylase F